MPMVIRSALPQNWTPSAGAEIITFDDVSDWSVSGTGTIESDSTILFDGKNTLKCSTADVSPSCKFRAPLPSTVNFACRPNSIDFYIYTPVAANIDTIYFTLAIGGAYTTYMYTPLKAHALRNGWNHVEFGPWSTWYYQPNPTSVNFLSTFTGLQIGIAAASGKTAIIYLADSLRWGKRSIPCCVIEFDNGYQCCYDDAADILAAKGFAATVGVNPAKLGTSWSPDAGGPYTVMDLAELQSLYADGWGMANHTWAHTSLASANSVSEAAAMLQPCQDYLEANGMPRAARHVIFPAGLFNDYTNGALAQVGALTGRGAYFYYGEAMPVHDLYRLRSYELWKGVTVADTKAIIDRCASGQLLTFFAHQITNDSPVEHELAVSDFEEIVDYLYQKRIRVMTIDEWYEGLTNPRYRSLPVGRA